MNFREMLEGGGTSLPVYDDIAMVLDDIELFPRSIEKIYRSAMGFDDETLDHLRFALLRVQIYSDIHRNEDMEQAQKIKYVAQVLEKIIFGSLMMEHEELGHD
ncbi:MAG TPA: hypothetical protein PLM60_10380 [Methanoregulaceae archaeon]|jgi:hypothetical protein|nr:hypothetical protein [Burkholderiaceae bacterium]NLH25091.1 hypothetical protein [Methanomicrobiales archaeon]HMZ32191.1 hypothetical protein [Methanoregulaceae archaeon]HNI41261.1 hypothetical protein [Methanoregulaceae archaeon]HNJ80060.1 hypothetical protein [Methanoregulaceae archaeon]